MNLHFASPSQVLTQWYLKQNSSFTAAGQHGIYTHFPFNLVKNYFSPKTCNGNY